MAGARPIDPRLLEHARALRRDATDAERLVWMLVRGRRLAGYEFRRQHPLGPYILDFFCAFARLAVDLDGGQHGTAEQRRYDRRRSDFLRARGVRELRFTNTDALRDTEGVLAAIWGALHELSAGRPSADPHPDPPPRRGGGDVSRGDP